MADVQRFMGTGITVTTLILAREVRGCAPTAQRHRRRVDQFYDDDPISSPCISPYFIMLSSTSPTA